MRILQIHLSMQRGGAYSSVQNIYNGMLKIGSLTENIFQEPLDALNKFNYDAVLVHSFQGRYIDSYIEVLEFLKKFNIPFVVLLHDYWPICPQTNFMNCNSYKLCDFDECDPMECGYNNVRQNLYNNYDFYDKGKLSVIYDILKESKTVCFSHQAIEIFNKKGLKPHLIHHGVDFDLFKPYNQPHDGFLVLFANAWGKKILKGYKHWEWLQANSSYNYQGLLGGKSFEYMPAFYNSGDCLLFLSLWPETFGLVILEALACDIPVISYDVGIAPEVIKDGINGYIVKNFSVKKVLERIEDVKNNKFHCRDSVKEFSVENMCEKYIKFLDS